MRASAVRNAYSARAQQYIELFDGDWDAHEADAGFITRHLAGLRGRVLDLGCGPGYWSAYLHQQGLEVTGIDFVPEFIEHARAAHPGPTFQIGALGEVSAHSAAGLLLWFSTIHLSPADIDAALAHCRQLLAPSGMLVLGFFASADEVTAFDHAVVQAWRWPAVHLVDRLAQAGFVEVERMERQVAARPDRQYGAIAARAI